MTKFRNLLFLLISIPGFIVFTWLFAVPDSLIKTTIEDSLSSRGRFNINASLEGLRKGFFFTVFAESLELKKEKTTVLRITNISSRINPLYLLKKQFAFSVKAKMGTGDIEGFFKLPGSGSLKIDQAELNAIPYLTSLGFGGSSLISARLNLKNSVIDVVFKIPDADIRSSAIGMSLPISSFREIQGTLSIKENAIEITSISLEGDKGYARLKGDITNGFMNLTLELMPTTGELTTLESTLISKYKISPGYYVIPIKGPLKPLNLNGF